MSYVEVIVKYLNQNYDKQTLKDTKNFEIAVEDISNKTGLLPSVIESAIFFWIGNLL